MVHSRGGRPTREAAPYLTERILDAATALFLGDGYGVTSLEAVADRAGVSKRTLYARFAGKEALLKVVVARLVQRWLPTFDAGLDQSSGLEATLLAAGKVMLATALAPEALALRRLFVAEAGRFPELVRVMQDAGTGVGVERLAGVLARAGIVDPVWAARQFMVLVLAAPQQQASTGPGLDAVAQAEWAARAVALFLHGAPRLASSAGADEVLPASVQPREASPLSPG